MVKWTDSQQLAIDSRGKNLLLSAAAGSGKTAVLVERIIQLILQDNANIDRFLIVTFTNAAAGEMRERISKALYQAIEEGVGDEQHLRRQIQLLDRAFISTLHSFCIDVVKRYFHLIEIDPVFRIGDNTETTLLKLEALEELFESEYERENPTFLDLVEMYGGNRNDQGLLDLVVSLYNFIQSKPQPEKWVRERIQDFAIEEEGFAQSLWHKTLIEQLSIDLGGAKDYFAEAEEIALLPGGPAVYEPILQGDILLVEALENSLGRGLIPFYETLQSSKHKNLKPAKEADIDLKEACQELRNKGKDIIKDISKKLLVKSPKEFVEELNELYLPMEYLGYLAIELGKGYGEKKVEKGILDFNDLEHYALAILQHREAVEEYREKFNYIFVDEYQDSNLIQETIVSSIKREDNVFLVGDVKQSIYRFRLADPSLFIEKYENYGDDDSSIDRRIDLSKNFRSRKEVIDGVNFIFRQLMGKKFGEISYDQRAALYLGSDFPEMREAGVELNIIEKNKEVDGQEEAEQEREETEQEREETLEEIEEMGDIEIEAHWVAKRINEILQTDIYDPKEESYRKVTYRDIVVLLRTTKGWSQTFSEVFISQGIPVYADVNTGYFETIEINMLMNLLKSIDNKRQDVPLLSVLRSPVFNLSTEELIQIRGGSAQDTYFEALEEYIKNNEDDLSKKLQEVLDKIAQWKEESRYIPIEDFLWKLLMDSQYYYYVGAMPGGLQRQANIRVLLDRARQFQQTSMKGLFHFIKFVDQLKSSSGDMGTAKILGENDNVVRLMSIHKSKGLEFPVVIIGGLGKQFNLRESRNSVLFHKDLGLGPNYVNLERRSYNESIAKIAMKNKIRYESLAEEMRVLYVALTRPKDKLILVGSIKNLERNIGKWAQAIGPYNFAKGKHFLDWIAPILMRHEQGQPLRERGDILWGEEKCKKDPSRWKINCINSREILTTEQEKEEARLDIKELLLDYRTQEESTEDEVVDRSEIIHRLQWKYKNQIATLLPSKLSVTDVKKSKENTEEVLSPAIPMMTARPAFMEGKRELTGQEKGVATHFVLQHLSLDQVDSVEGIREQLEKMIFKELLREGEAKAVDVARLLAFFQSPIGKRMREADTVQRELPFNLVKRAEEILPTLVDVDSCGEEILVQGVIDCCFQEGEELVLIDYKTDYYHDESSKQEIVEKYSIQIQLYKEALEKIQGKSVKEAYLYLFHGNEEVRL